MNKMYDVVTIGGAFQDLFVFSNDFKVLRDPSFKSGSSLCFDYGAKLDVERIEYHSGGSAVNTALCFSKLGFSTALLTFLGSDSSAEKIISQIEIAGISSQLLKQDNQPTGTSIILSHNGDRTILSYHGDRDFNQLKLAKNLKTNWYYLSALGKKIDDLENKLIENIAKNGSGLIWNPGPLQIKQGALANRHLLHLCNVLILNREEAMSFSACGKTKIEDCLKTLANFGPKLVVVTDGKNGARVYDGKVYYQINASDDERVDATGAGDAFASTMASRIIQDCSDKKAQSFTPDRETILEALKWGIVNSGSVVGHVGGNSGLLSTSEIIKKAEKMIKLEAKVY